MRKSALFFLFAVSAALIFPKIVLSDAGDPAPARTRLSQDAGNEASSGGAVSPAISDKAKDKSFIGSGNWKGDGAIVESKTVKLDLSAGDFVYTNLGSYDVKEGTVCDIFHKGNEVTDPDTGKLLGYEIRHVGTLQIVGGVGVNTSLAKITSSTEAVQIGDELKIIEGSQNEPSAK